MDQDAAARSYAARMHARYPSLEPYLTGDQVIGDDFTGTELAEWYADEEYGYAQLAASYDGHGYVYHAMNAWHFRRLAGRAFPHALAFGCARGDDVAPLAPRAQRFTAIEPAESAWQPTIGGVAARYLKPTLIGELPVPTADVDLVVWLGVLHHVATVSRVLEEFARVLKPGGVALIREPIRWMGDWRSPRRGLTRRERGLPARFLRTALEQAGLRIRHVDWCSFAGTVSLARLLGEREPWNRRSWVRVDAIASALSAWNVPYRARTLFGKLGPGAIAITAERAGG